MDCSIQGVYFYIKLFSFRLFSSARPICVGVSVPIGNVLIVVLSCWHSFHISYHLFTWQSSPPQIVQPYFHASSIRPTPTELFYLALLLAASLRSHRNSFIVMCACAITFIFKFNFQKWKMTTSSKKREKRESEWNFTWNSHVYHWHIDVHMIFGRNDTEMFKVFDISLEMESWFIAVDLSAFESHIRMQSKP